MPPRPALWPAQYADAANRSYTGTAGAHEPTLDWTRSVKGDLGAAVAWGPTATWRPTRRRRAAVTDGVGERFTAGKRWCTRLIQGGGLRALFDGFDNLTSVSPA